MGITAQDVNKLRQATGAGMMDCKKALVEADGDFEAAVDNLRKKGQKVSAKRADKEASEGSVFVETSSDSQIGYLIALNCETDFVAKNDEFVGLGNSILGAAVSNQVGTVEDLQSAALSDGRTVTDHLSEFMGKIGEKIEISNYVVMKGQCVVPYIHSNAKLGVMVSLTGAAGEPVVEIGKDVAMQIAAMNPLAVDKDGIDQEVVDRELEVGKEQARAEGKPEAMLEKIANGRLNKFYKENTLLNQSFVKDGSKTVQQVLGQVDNALTVTEFKRISIG